MFSKGWKFKFLYSYDQSLLLVYIVCFGSLRTAVSLIV